MRPSSTSALAVPRRPVRGPASSSRAGSAGRPPAEAGLTARILFSPWGAAAALAGILVWAYWPVVRPLFRDWQADQNYSIGQLVPLAALYLAWRDRGRLARLELRPCAWGVGLILLAQAALAFGLVFMFESAERYSLVLMAAGLVLLAGGRSLFWELKWILLLLFLMVPLPGRIHNLISDPLQGLSTQGALVGLELLGITTLREGHVLVLNGEVPVAVAEACSGLRMLTAFVVVSYVFAYLIGRPWWQKLVLVCSSVPIAVACNLLRLVVTALLFLMTSDQTAETFFHDFAGITMMPLAFLFLIAELWIMARLVAEDGGRS